MSAEYAVFEGKDFTMESNSRTAEQIAEGFKPTEAPVPQADGDEGEETPSIPAPEANDKPTGKPRSDMKARMLEATRKESEAKKRADEIERRAQALEAELRQFKERQPADRTPEAPKAPKEGRPKLEDFESLEDHTEAVANWLLDTREKTAKETAQKAESEKATEAKFRSFAERMGAHVEKDPEFWARQNEAVVALRPFSVLSEEERKKAGPLNALADHFLVSEKAPALIEYFSGKPEEVQRLSTLHPGDFWRELGRIEERLGAATTATAPPPISKAAPPARPVTGGPPITNSGPSENDSDDEYLRKRQAQELRKRQAARR